MTAIEKYTLDRLRARGIKIGLNCPHCRGAWLELKDPRDLDPMHGVTCFKCKAQVLLDGLSLTVIRERAPAAEG